MDAIFARFDGFLELFVAGGEVDEVRSTTAAAVLDFVVDVVADFVVVVVVVVAVVAVVAVAPAFLFLLVVVLVVDVVVVLFSSSTAANSRFCNAAFKPLFDNPRLSSSTFSSATVIRFTREASIVCLLV